MSKINLEELAQHPGHPIAGIFLKYASELKVVIRRDAGGAMHYFVYIDTGDYGPEESTMKLFRSLVCEILSFQECLEGSKFNPCQPRYWSEGDRAYPENRYYATMSFAKVRFSVYGSAHFFLSRKGFDVAISHEMPFGWGHDE